MEAQNTLRTCGLKQIFNQFKAFVCINSNVNFGIFFFSKKDCFAAHVRIVVWATIKYKWYDILYLRDLYAFYPSFLIGRIRFRFRIRLQRASKSSIQGRGPADPCEVDPDPSLEQKVGSGPKFSYGSKSPGPESATCIQQIYRVINISAVFRWLFRVYRILFKEIELGVWPCFFPTDGENHRQHGL